MRSLKQPSRALIIYSVAVLLAGLAMFTVARRWHDKREVAKFEQKQHAKEKISVPSYVAYYGPKALYANSALCLLLLALGPLATRTMERAKSEAPHAGTTDKKWSAIIVGATMVISACWIAPRMSHGLWADEATTMLKFAVGDYNRGDDGKMELKHIAPVYRQFALKTPNNHMLYSTFAGMVHQQFFKQDSAPDAPYFSEFLLRVPAFIAGMVALLGVWWLAREIGLKQYAWLPVVLVAMHPWHVQYTAEARGYSMVMALVPTSLAAVLAAVRSGRWRWWFLYSLCQVMMIDTWPLAVDVLLTSNAVVFCIILSTFWRTGDCLTQLGRWGVCCLLAAMTALQLLLPAFPQIQQYMNEQPAFKDFHAIYVQDAYSMLLTGSRWDGDAANPYLVSWQANFDHHPILASSFFLLLTILMLLGLVKLWRTSKPARWIGCLFIIIPSFIIIHLYLRKSIFLPWYWVPAMPGFLVLVSAGIVALMQRFAMVHKLVIPLTLIVMGMGVLPQQLNLKHAPVQQNKETALATRKVINPTHPDFDKEALTAYVAMFYKGYDTLAQPVGSAADLDKLTTKAALEQRPLFVNLSRANVLDAEERKILPLLDDATKFKKHPPFYGTDIESTRWVYEYIPPTAATVK